MSVSRGLQIMPVEGIGEVRPGDDLSRLLAAAAPDLADGDVVVVTQKVVSKAEAQLVPLNPGDPASKAQVVAGESVRILRRRGELVIAETRHGFVCANAGVDLSNVEEGWAALLPEDPDRSARRLRDGLRGRLGVAVAVVISDTFGRPWRRGLTDVAIGCAGIRAVVDLRGTDDALGRELAVTEMCVVDELAAAAELVMGKASGICAAVVRGVDPAWLGRGEVVGEVVRAPAEDLFRSLRAPSSGRRAAASSGSTRSRSATAPKAASALTMVSMPCTAQVAAWTRSLVPSGPGASRSSASRTTASVTGSRGVNRA
jgi:coenzyme F420-0:L-glutamate ligase/coenzyme F420-1:gamma-L-glutamate ligase